MDDCIETTISEDKYARFYDHLKKECQTCAIDISKFNGTEFQTAISEYEKIITQYDTATEREKSIIDQCRHLLENTLLDLLWKERELPSTPDKARYREQLDRISKALRDYSLSFRLQWWWWVFCLWIIGLYRAYITPRLPRVVRKLKNKDRMYVLFAAFGDALVTVAAYSIFLVKVCGLSTGGSFFPALLAIQFCISFYMVALFDALHIENLTTAKDQVPGKILCALLLAAPLFVVGLGTVFQLRESDFFKYIIHLGPFWLGVCMQFFVPIVSVCVVLKLLWKCMLLNYFQQTSDVVSTSKVSSEDSQSHYIPNCILGAIMHSVAFSCAAYNVLAAAHPGTAWVAISIEILVNIFALFGMCKESTGKAPLNLSYSLWAEWTYYKDIVYTAKDRVGFVFKLILASGISVAAIYFGFSIFASTLISSALPLLAVHPVVDLACIGMFFVLLARVMKGLFLFHSFFARLLVSKGLWEKHAQNESATMDKTTYTMKAMFG